ncbi:hypothetical protein FDP41_003565 [Naegleria fowleri]|uniref:Uncharacterized protein n=1 Tax=Naegleria fowleri TaxID=5763 RepID=A0A6A5BI72_NAEFO|nr:uncharacterized protein FDP41_003565 [Naegleria fowleri]KAF0977573.1 hypothetical protein FDP41_003565 [Naegleria fowleri]
MFSSPSKNSLNNRRLPLSVLFHHQTTTSVINHSSHSSATITTNNSSSHSPTSFYPTSPSSLLIPSCSLSTTTATTTTFNNRHSDISSHHRSGSPSSSSFTSPTSQHSNHNNNSIINNTINTNNNNTSDTNGHPSHSLNGGTQQRSSSTIEKSFFEFSDVDDRNPTMKPSKQHVVLPPTLRERTTVVVMNNLVVDHDDENDYINHIHTKSKNTTHEHHIEKRPMMMMMNNDEKEPSQLEDNNKRGKSLSKITKDLKEKQQPSLPSMNHGNGTTTQNSQNHLVEENSQNSKTTRVVQSVTSLSSHSEPISQHSEQQLLSTAETFGNSSGEEHQTPTTHEKPSLKRRMSSFLFRKSLTHEQSEATKSFKISNAARKSLTGSVTNSSPQLNGQTVTHLPNKQATKSISKSSRQSWSKSFFSSKSKFKENIHSTTSHSTQIIPHQQQQALKNHHHPSQSLHYHSRLSSGSSNSSAALTIVHSNGFGLSESPDTSSSSFDFATLESASVDNASTGGDLTYVEPSSSTNTNGSGKKNILSEEFANVQHQFGSVESLRATFLQFISNQTLFQMNSSNSSSSTLKAARVLENELLIELYFMDFMYGNNSGKLSRKLTNLSSILTHLDSFCKLLLSKFDRKSQLWRDIIEDQASHMKYPYLECMVVDTIDNDDECHSWMTHQRLGQFLKHTYEYYVKSVSDLPEDFQAGQLKKQIQMLCDMFYVELDDYFMIFQSKNYKYMKQWISEGLKHKVLPNHVIELYRKDKEYHDKMQGEFKITPEDFTVDHVIDSDWKFMKYFCNDFSSHWFLTFSQIGKVTYWNSFSDFSTDNLSLRMSKVVGYFDYPIEQVAKALANDDHLQYQFKNMKWSSYSSINESNSLHKYPSVLMSGSFDSVSLFLSRSIQLVFSTKCHFCEDELTEVQTFFKTCDVLKEKSKKDLIKIKMPLLGMRILTKLDNHRTRFVEVRFSNLGGLLNSKIVLFNPLTSKKTCLETYQGLLEAIKRSEQQGFALPNCEKNYLMRLWKDYCKHYFNMDIIEKYK